MITAWMGSRKMEVREIPDPQILAPAAEGYRLVDDTEEPCEEILLES